MSDGIIPEKEPAAIEAPHAVLMRRALSLARRGMGRTSPNPPVGCVIASGDEVVGEGWHRKAGTPHAEIHALAAAGERARGADVYVTLEPCSHHGRTPPCADALIRAGVARVFVGIRDPNPLVSGAGLAKLEAAGIQVRCGILSRECERVVESFIKHVVTGMPFVVFKSAMTLDGMTATSRGESKWITSEDSRKYVHRIRSIVDAVMVGVGTALADDPSLNCRLAGKGRDPVRIIVDSRLRLPEEAKVLSSGFAAGTLVVTVEEDPVRRARLESLGAEVLLCRSCRGRVDLEDMMRRLGARGIQSILLEGGSTLAHSALQAGLIDKFLLFFAPKILGGGDGKGLFSGKGAENMADAFALTDIAVRRFGNDIMVEAYPERKCLPV